MGHRAKPRIFNRGVLNDLEAPKEMFNVLSHREVKITTQRFYLIKIN